MIKSDYVRYAKAETISINITILLPALKSIPDTGAFHCCRTETLYLYILKRITALGTQGFPPSNNIICNNALWFLVCSLGNKGLISLNKTHNCTVYKKGLLHTIFPLQIKYIYWVTQTARLSFVGLLLN